MLHPDESYQVMGACFEVHNRMGAGFLEAVYQECLAIEFQHQHIPFTAQPPIRLSYRDRPLEQAYRPDFVCFEKILIELKAISCLNKQHEAQVFNYLHATGLELGILINFGAHPKLESRRVALSQKRR